MQFVSEGESPWGCTADLLKWINIPNANVSEIQIRFQPKVAALVVLILCRHIGAKYSFSTTRHLEHKILRHKTRVYQHFTTSHLEMKNWCQLFVLQAANKHTNIPKKKNYNMRISRGVCLFLCSCTVQILLEFHKLTWLS